MLKTYSIPITEFHAQNLFHSNDKISCSKPISFQSPMTNFMLKLIPFQQRYSTPATPSCLPAVFFGNPSPRWEQLQRQYFTDGLGLPGKLAEYSSKSNSPPVPGIISVVFVVRDQGDCGKRIELHFSYHYQMSSATSCIPPITTRCPV